MADSYTSGDTTLAIQIAQNSSTALVAAGPKRKTRFSSVIVSKKGKRWGMKEEKPYQPVACAEMPTGLTAKEVDQLLRELRLEELTRKVADQELEDMDPDIRPPSPPPTYDKDGQRTNSREVRLKRAMENEYQRLVRYAIRNIIGYLPPSDWRPKKLSKKILIPVDKYPQISFIGIIVGPRGVNHKRMQEESGAKITIRGKDISDKWQTEEEMAMQQHVHIEADHEEQIEVAEKMVAPLLDPESKEFMTQRDSGQLQLAKVVGFTIDKAEVRCMICLAQGHYSFECPEAPFNQFKADVMCTICGDKGHVAMDCPQKIAKVKEVTKESLLEKARIDKEYREMMGEMGVDMPMPEAPAAGEIQKYSGPGGKDEKKDVGLEIHPSMCSKFIGKAGSHVQALQTTTGAKITCEDLQPGKQMRRVLLSGPDDAIEAAKEAVEKWLKENPIPANQSAWKPPGEAKWTPPAVNPSQSWAQNWGKAKGGGDDWWGDSGGWGGKDDGWGGKGGWGKDDGWGKGGWGKGKDWSYGAWDSSWDKGKGKGWGKGPYGAPPAAPMAPVAAPAAPMAPVAQFGMAAPKAAPVMPPPGVGPPPPPGTGPVMPPPGVGPPPGMPGA